MALRGALADDFESGRGETDVDTEGSGTRSSASTEGPDGADSTDATLPAGRLGVHPQDAEPVGAGDEDPDAGTLDLDSTHPLPGGLGEAGRRGELHRQHAAAGAEFAEQGGRRLPASYGDARAEHDAVRRKAGLFDLSHLTIVDLEGAPTREWLRTLLVSDAGRLEVGQGLYTCLCNEHGGVIDNLTVYRLGEERWRLIGNAEPRVRSLFWLERRRPAGVTLSLPPDVVMLAVQGPEAVAIAGATLRATRSGCPDLDALPRFGLVTDGPLFVSRTGCSGEDGLEIVLPAEEGGALWEALLVAGVRPCGLLARDTLRLEAGLSRHGADLDEAHTPLECGLGWMVDLSDPDRAFVGREPLAAGKAVADGSGRVGLVLETPAALEPGQAVQLAGRDVGSVTSALHSPTLGRWIALARTGRPIKCHCDVIVDGRPLAARSVRLPFVRPGSALEKE